MANAVTIQTILDGPRNCVIKLEGILDTSDIASTVLVDPALLIGTDNTGTLKAGQLRIMKVVHNVEDGLAVNLFWDATTPVRIEEITGRGNQCYKDFGGLPNNSGAGKTGKIFYSTQGWGATQTLSFSLILELVKTS